MSSIASITLDSRTLHHQASHIQHERDVAMADLMAECQFQPVGLDNPGPYHLHISIADNRLAISVSANDDPLTKITVPLLPLKTIIRDYFLMCESYYKALGEANPMRLEAIDMGRRGIHNEAAELLKDVLEPKVIIDFATARRLFTLICVLHMR